MDIQQYFKIKGKDLSAETLKKHKMSLNKIFEKAVINDICVKNPCIDIKITSDIKPEEKRTYTKKQCELVIDYSKSHRFGLGVNFMLEYGLSRSELLGLMWEDVDTKNKLLYITRGVTDVQNADTMKIIMSPRNETKKCKKEREVI